MGSVEAVHQLRADRRVLTGDDGADPGADVVAGVGYVVHDHADGRSRSPPGAWRHRPHRFTAIAHGRLGEHEDNRCSRFRAQLAIIATGSRWSAGGVTTVMS